MDEVFGSKLRCYSVSGKRYYARRIRRIHFPTMHDYIVVLCKGFERSGRLTIFCRERETERKITRTRTMIRVAPGRQGDLYGRKYRTESRYIRSLCHLGEQFRPPAGRYWTFLEADFKSLLQDGAHLVGKDGNGFRSLSAISAMFRRRRASNVWSHEEVGHNRGSEA